MLKRCVRRSCPQPPLAPPARICVRSLRMPQSPQVVLYDQYNNASTTGSLSATFDDFPTFNADLADDFVVPGGQTWNVESIDADGIYFNGAGPAFNWNVFIYADNAGLPGAQVFSATNQPVSVVGTTFTVTLPVPAVLTAGTYWIEIQANMDFATQGEWGWTDRTVQSNSPAAWQNPGGGFGLCPSWTSKLICIPTAGGPDQVYRLNGTMGGPTPTPTPTPTCTPGGSPGPWTQAAPVAIDHYGGFMDSDGTFAYEGGGYSFSAADNINQFGRFDPVANTWTPLAAVPDLNNGEASAVYAPNVNKLFVFGGEEVSLGTVVNTTRIYDIGTNTWSTGAPMPDVRAFMGSGYYNGKIYLVGGYSTGNVDPSFGQVWEYDPVLNTFNTSRTSMPITMGGPGFGIINGHIYIAGGRDINNTNLNTLYDYDIAADTWAARANLPTGINVPGSAVIGDKLWVFGGGNPFAGGSAAAPASAKKGLGASRTQSLSPDTTNMLQVYDPVSNSWTSGPNLNQQRSFPAGTDVGNTAVAVGGYTGSNTTTFSRNQRHF